MTVEKVYWPREDNLVAWGADGCIHLQQEWPQEDYQRIDMSIQRFREFIKAAETLIAQAETVSDPDA